MVTSEQGGSAAEAARQTSSGRQNADQLNSSGWFRTVWDYFWRAASSGLFFMMVGVGFLVVANQTMGAAHSSFTFVLVVVGVAILLFGTGTQGIGQFETKQGEANYKVALAGGAGVLAFCVAIGIVWKADKIKNAFEMEKRYLRVIIEPDSKDGVSDYVFAKYVPTAWLDGEYVPVVMRNKTMEAYVYYLAGKQRANRTLIVNFFLKPLSEGAGKPIVESKHTITLNDEAQGDSNGGLDIPEYRTERFYVRMGSDVIPGTEVDKNQRPESAAQLPPSLIFPTEK